MDYVYVIGCPETEYNFLANRKFLRPYAGELLLPLSLFLLVLCLRDLRLRGEIERDSERLDDFDRECEFLLRLDRTRLFSCLLPFHL